MEGLGIGMRAGITASAGEDPTSSRRGPETPPRFRRTLPSVLAQRPHLWLYRLGSPARSHQCKETETLGPQFDFRHARPGLHLRRLPEAPDPRLNLPELLPPRVFLALRCMHP